MISIVTAYYNRKKLFYETLKSITRSNFKDVELIAVDDGSSTEHRIEDLQTEFPFLKIIRLEKEDKWYFNPCIPFNIGIRESKGDIIVLQNPECLHAHDVLTYFSQNVDDSNYITLSAYGVSPALSNKLLEHNENNTVVDFLKTLPQQSYVGYESAGWYNHSKFRPVFFHFCSAISRTNMKKLNGFDERYGMGIGYDDNEILARLRRLGLKITIEDDVSVIHQYHTTAYWNKPNVSMLTERNRSLFVNVTMNEQRIDANLIKLWKD